MANTPWLAQVIHHLETDEPELFKEAIKACEEESETPAPPTRNAKAFMEWMRGDEPQDVKDMGDTPKEYAEFLIEEWKLFGPQGE